MFVSVAYYDEAIKAFKTRAYTYETHMELKTGDKVAAPVKNRGTGVIEDKRAIVLETDLDKPAFPCNIITKYWSEVEENG